MAQVTTTKSGDPERGEPTTLKLPSRDPQLFLLRGGRRAWGGISTPLDDPDFSNQLKSLDRLAPLSTSFLDVGCGRGLMMSYVKRLNPSITVVGIDVRAEALLHAARHGEARRVDALQYKNYKDHDLIYLYRPLVEYREQLALESLIIREMSVGATLVSLLPVHHLLCRPRERGCYTKEKPSL